MGRNPVKDRKAKLEEIYESRLQVIKQTPAIAEMDRWAGQSLDFLEQHWDEYERDRNAFEKEVGRRIRAGIRDDKAVAAWITDCRSTRDRERLRRFKDQCIEIGVFSGMTLETAWVIFRTTEMLEKRMPDGKPYTVVEVWRVLRNSLRYSSPEDDDSATLLTLTQENWRCLQAQFKSGSPLDSKERKRQLGRFEKQLRRFGIRRKGDGPGVE